MKLNIIVIFISNIRSAEKITRGVPFINYFSDTLQNLTTELKTSFPKIESETKLIEQLGDLVSLLKKNQSDDDQFSVNKMDKFKINLKKKVDDFLSVLNEDLLNDFDDLSEVFKFVLGFEEQLNEFEDILYKEMEKEYTSQTELVKLKSDLKTRLETLIGFDAKRLARDFDEEDDVKNLKSELKLKIDELTRFIDEKIDDTSFDSFKTSDFFSTFKKKLGDLAVFLKQQLEKDSKSNSSIKIKFGLEFEKKLKDLSNFIGNYSSENISNIPEIKNFEVEYEKRIADCIRFVKEQLDKEDTEYKNIAEFRIKLNENLESLRDLIQLFFVGGRIDLSKIAELGLDFENKSKSLIKLLKEEQKANSQKGITINEIGAHLLDIFNALIIFFKQISPENFQGLAEFVNLVPDLEEELKKFKSANQKLLEKKGEDTSSAARLESLQLNHVDQVKSDASIHLEKEMQDQPLDSEQEITRSSRSESIELTPEKTLNDDVQNPSTAKTSHLEQKNNIDGVEISGFETKNAELQSVPVKLNKVTTDVNNLIDNQNSSIQILDNEPHILSAGTNFEQEQKSNPNNLETYPSEILNAEFRDRPSDVKQNKLHLIDCERTESNLNGKLEERPKALENRTIHTDNLMDDPAAFLDLLDDYRVAESVKLGEQTNVGPKNEKSSVINVKNKFNPKISETIDVEDDRRTNLPLQKQVKRSEHTKTKDQQKTRGPKKTFKGRGDNYKSNNPNFYIPKAKAILSKDAGTLDLDVKHQMGDDPKTFLPVDNKNIENLISQAGIRKPEAFLNRAKNFVNEDAQKNLTKEQRDISKSQDFIEVVDNKPQSPNQNNPNQKDFGKQQNIESYNSITLIFTISRSKF